MLNFFYLSIFWTNFFKKNFLFDFNIKIISFKWVFYFLNISVIFFGEKYLIEYQTKYIFVIFYNSVFKQHKIYFFNTLQIIDQLLISILVYINICLYFLTYKF